MIWTLSMVQVDEAAGIFVHHRRSFPAWWGWPVEEETQNQCLHSPTYEIRAQGEEDITTQPSKAKRDHDNLVLEIVPSLIYLFWKLETIVKHKI